MPAKPHMNIITSGHVDHGKSTIVGRLLFESGSIREEELRKLQTLAQENKIEGGEFAYIMDN
jgi:elongation factor 1-alpha